MNRALAFDSIIRIVATAFFITMTLRSRPHLQSRFQFPALGRRWIAISIFALIFLVPKLAILEYSTLTVNKVASSLIFAALIALSEETMVRGWFYARFEPRGRNVALIASSIFFGAMHIVNFGSSLDDRYVSMQILVATAMGYFFAALMIYSGSIWVPIIFHFLIDFPVLMIDGFDSKIPSDNGQLIIGAVGAIAIFIAMAQYLLQSRQRYDRQLLLLEEAHQPFGVV